MTSTLQERFSDLLQRHVHKLVIRGRRATGLALCHDDQRPSFSADLERCVWFCYACGRGGGVRDFARLVGEEWGSTRSESRSAKAHRLALAAARDYYHRWQREKLITLSDEYRALCSESVVVEIGYRATVRQPSMYSESERSYWAQSLAAVYDRLSELEYSLDLLTFRKFEAERLKWWRSEEEEGQHVQPAA